MKRKTKIILASIITFLVILVSGIAIFAYYEYYGQYQTILNIDGTIKLDAFDVLYPELRKEPSYGKTPDNPFVIDNATRLRNLIKLNNNGKLEKSKQKDNVEKYYFCLQFDSQENSQILDLSSEGDFQTIGNNEYPFVDELSGIVYGYNYTDNLIAYYSGCLPVYTKVDSKIYINGIESDLDATASPYSSWEDNVEYLRLEKQYDTSATTAEVMAYATNSQTSYIKVSDTTIIHQIIANETIVATDNQLDIGFINNIGNGGYAHDIILNNQLVIAKEENLFDSWISDIASIFGDHKRVKTSTLDERHIGLFCGHIDEGGNAKNISVAGMSTIDIDTKRVNYFSNYTTVGFIDENALIGGRLFSEIATDSMLDGEIAGVLFADEIYEAHGDASATTDYDGATHYELTDISASGAWPGTDGTSFEYGSFTFMLSANDDTVSSIWSDSGELKMLGDQNYTIIGSVLYCSDEYRYQANNGINQASASVKETVYNGVTKLENTGNVIDQGKYIIVAHVNDKYYAVKIIATEDSSGNITYSFDKTDKIDVTDFINGNGNLYQSALWEVEAPTITPSFKNCRFETQYLKGDTSSNALTSANNLSTSASQFGVSLVENTVYFDYKNNDNSYTRYYLNFNAGDNEFYFSEEVATTIELFKITDGYELKVVKNYNSITDLGSYLIIAEDGNGSYYLVGVDTDGNGTVLSDFTADLKSTSISGLANGLNSPVTMTATEYQTYLNYIWRVNKLGGNGLSFTDKLSSSLYLSHIGESLALSGNSMTWTYGTGGNDTDSCRLANGGYYISYNRNSSSTSTKYICTTANPGYTLYLYEITPQDDTPPYITYDGARYLDAVGSTIETGTYAVIATDEYGEQYAIGINNNTISKTKRFVQTTTYNELYTYYLRSGAGTVASPYVYTPENISEYTRIDTITNQSTLNTAISTYGTVYYEEPIYTYTQAFTIQQNTTYYISRRTEATTFTRGNTYYSNRNATTIAFTIDANTTYYSDTNGTVATTFTRGNTYYTRELSSYRYTSISTYINGATYYYKTLNYGTHCVDYLYSSGYDYYTWNVSDSTDASASTTSSPYFKNTHSSNYYLNGSSVSTTASVVYYDAINQQFFYKDNGTVKYVYVNSSGVITYSDTAPSKTKVSLYEIDSKYSYNGMTRITSDNYTTGFSSGLIMISTMDLTNTANASYLVGIDSFDGITNLTPNLTCDVTAGYYSMQNNYSIVGNSLITTKDMSNYIWMYSGETYTVGGNSYFNIYNYGWHNSGISGAQTNHLYLAASKAAGGNRQLVMNYYSRCNCYQGATNGNGNYNEIRNNNITGFSMDTYSYLYIRGNSNSYYLGVSNSTSTMALSSSSGGLNSNIYYYYFTNRDIISVLTLVSSEGDILDETIHYAIAAENAGNYYAMTYDDANSSNGIFGTDMTNQIQLIKNAGTYNSLTTIPLNCDWEQVSNSYELRFKHFASSSSDTYNYLDQTQNNGINSLEYNVAYTQTTAYYYDIINKILSFKDNDTLYYITYNSNLNKFDYSVNKADAAKIVLIRYTPSYQVERVSKIDNSINSGEYIIAGHSVNGYTTFGMDNTQFVKSFDITNYLTSDLTEEAYETILGYIWEQNNSSSYNSSQQSSTITLQFSNALTGTGFAAYNHNTYQPVYFGPNSDLTNWDSSIDSDGLWRLYYGNSVTGDGWAAWYVDYIPSTTTSTLKIDSTYIANYSYISGTNSVSTNGDDTKQVAIYNVNDLENKAVNLVSNEKYIIFVKSGSYWYMLYLNNTTLSYEYIGKNLNDLDSKLQSLDGYNYILSASDGPSNKGLTYGNYLYFNSGSSTYYLCANNGSLTVNTTQQVAVTNNTMHWVYNYNDTYINKSSLSTVYEETVNTPLSVSGSKVITSGSATYLYSVNYSNSKYTLGNIASSPITQGNLYALVIFENGNYYVVSREAEDEIGISYVSYGSGLPTSLSDLEVFTGKTISSGYSFTQTVNGDDYYLTMDVDKTLTLSDNPGNNRFTYSSSNINSSASFTSASSGAYELYLFRVSRKDELDNTTDVTVTLEGKNKADASLSVIQSENYIIVANVDGKYYALTMEDYETIIPLDITDTMEEALAGGNIRLYESSVFEQLGSEYSLIFNSQAFAGSYYYLLDGTYDNRKDNDLTNVNDDSPVVTPVSLYDSNNEYYLLEVETVKSTLSDTIIDESETAYYYFVSGCYVRAEEYSENLVYYTITATLQTDITDFEENKTYYISANSEYYKATEYKNGVKYYTRSGTSPSYTYTEASGVTSENFSTDTYYIYLSNSSYMGVSSKNTNLNNISDDYKWTIYTYADNSKTGYVIGYYDDLQSNISYLYYSDGMFRLTNDLSLAIANNSLVQVYRLGEENRTAETFKTFNIYLEKDNVTIISFPLNEVLDANDIETYSSTVENEISQENGTTMSVIPGEYLFAVKYNDDHYYALTLDNLYGLAYSDITLIFDGNYVRDENGYYCISVNTKYLWNQVASSSQFTVNSATNVSGLQFENCGYSGHKLGIGSNYDITINITDATTGAANIICNGQYLTFAPGTGFGWGAQGNAATIYMYAVGATAAAKSEDEVLTYTYYSSNLNSIDYTFFSFNKYHITDLPNYANAFGTYEYTTGWYVNSTNMLEEVNSSVYFANAIGQNDSDFNQVSYTYDYLNDSGTYTPMTLNYYAPKGSTSFAISDVSETDPVYVSVIVSSELMLQSFNQVSITKFEAGTTYYTRTGSGTEQSPYVYHVATTYNSGTTYYTNSYNERLARYLSLWKVADYNAETAVAYKPGTEEVVSTATGYLSIFRDMMLTPYAAIPLANHYDTTKGSSSASLVKVNDNYYYLSDYDYDHLIAHTFILTEPGIYYLGTTTGSVAISYLSIDKMRDVDESEDSTKNLSEEFTIDYVWGESATGSTFDQINTTANVSDSGVGTIAYVGRTESSEELTWVHSNLYPEFINGTPGVWEPDSGTTYYTVEVEVVKHIVSFTPGTTYYTYDGSSYAEATTFDYNNDYYVLNSGNYELVHEGYNSSKTYYYIINKDNNLYFEVASTYARKVTYFTLTVTAHTNLSSFTSNVPYYVLSDYSYNRVKINSFAAGVTYYTFDGSSYNVASSYNENETYYVSSPNYELVYNPTDLMNMTIERTYNSSTNVSTTTVNYETSDNIYYYGYGVMYINSNKLSTRNSRVIILNYTEASD